MVTPFQSELARQPTRSGADGRGVRIDSKPAATTLAKSVPIAGPPACSTVVTMGTMTVLRGQETCRTPSESTRREVRTN